MLRTGEHLRSAHNVVVDYLSFLPRDHLWLSTLTPATFPRNFKTMDGTTTSISPRRIFNTVECAELSSFMRMKHGGSDAEWERRCNVIGAYMTHYIEAERPDCFVIWNGEDHVGRIICKLARTNGVKVLFLENGYFPQTLQLDTEGVNSSSSICNLSYKSLVESTSNRIEVTPIPCAAFEDIPALKPAALLKCALKRKTSANYYAQYPEQRGSSWLSRQKLERARRRIPFDTVNLPEKFLFVPLQVHDDTQVLLNCKHFNTVEKFFDHVYAAARQALGPDYPIVVKEHPEDLGRYSYEALRRKYSDVIWLKKYSIDSLLERASLVALINSSVGLQALQRGRATVVYGESFYSKPEVSFYVSDLRESVAQISAAAAGVPDDMAKRIDRFIAHLSDHRFIAMGWKDLTPSGVSALAARMLTLLG